MEEKKENLLRIYNLAALRGLCRTKKEFAALLGVNDKGLSAAMNGSERHLTDSLLRKVQAWADQNNLEKDSPKEPEPQRGVFVPEATQKMFDNMAETIRIQAQMLASFHGAAQFIGGAYAPQKDLTDVE